MIEHVETWKDDCRYILLAQFVTETEAVFLSLDDADDAGKLADWLCCVGNGKAKKRGKRLWPELYRLAQWVVDGLDADDCFDASEAALVALGCDPWEPTS